MGGREPWPVPVVGPPPHRLSSAPQQQRMVPAACHLPAGGGGPWAGGMLGRFVLQERGLRLEFHLCFGIQDAWRTILPGHQPRVQNGAHNDVQVVAAIPWAESAVEEKSQSQISEHNKAAWGKGEGSA